MSLYLKASSEIELLNEWDGKKGKFVKTFGINDKRNKNGWRATWPGIKKNMHTFLDDGGRPGIEYINCEGTVCDLDHTDGTTKQISIDVQEDFRVTTLIDYTFDDDIHTAYLIHEVLNDETWEKLQNQKLKFVSPSLWPKSGGFEIIGEMPNGLPKLDVWEWDALHTAFVNNPAFGDEARVTAMCEGENCHMQLLTAKQLSAETDDGLAPLREIPILVRHKGKLRFVSVSKEIADQLYANFEKDIAINEETLLQIISENETKDSSFSACTCSEIKMDEDKRIKELESKLKGMEDEKEKLTSRLKAEECNNEKFKASLSGAKVVEAPGGGFDILHDTNGTKLAHKATREEANEERLVIMKRNGVAANDDEDEKVKTAKKAQEESEKKLHSAEDENKDLKAKLAEPLIAKIMLNAKEKLGEEQSTKLEASLKAKTIPQLEEAIIMSNLSASQNNPGVHFEFSDGTTKIGSALSAKSLEESFNEEVA